MSSLRTSKLVQFSRVILFAAVITTLYSSILATRYRSQLPTQAMAAEMRFTPRVILGKTVYESSEEDLRLTIVESVSIPLCMAAALLYLICLMRSTIAGASAEEETGVEAILKMDA